MQILTLRFRFFSYHSQIRNFNAFSKRVLPSKLSGNCYFCKIILFLVTEIRRIGIFFRVLQMKN